MTLNAVTKNREWNTKLVSTKDGAVVKDVAFTNNLNRLIENGGKRALLLSSTVERDIFMTGERNLGNIRVSAAWS